MKLPMMHAQERCHCSLDDLIADGLLHSLETSALDIDLVRA